MAIRRRTGGVLGRHGVECGVRSDLELLRTRVRVSVLLKVWSFQPFRVHFG